MKTCKTCTKCRKSLTEDNFHKNKSTKGGLHGWCKACRRQVVVTYDAARREERRNYAAKWRAAHPEYSAKYYAAHRKERRKHKAKYRVAHREENREYCAKYQIDHQKEIKARRKKYHASHRAEHRRRKLKRRYAEKLNRGRSYTAWERRLRAKRTFVCYWCGQRKPIRLLHIDHIVPVSKGGPDCRDNVVPSCVQCNQTKYTKDLKPWTASVGMLAI